MILERRASAVLHHFLRSRRRPGSRQSPASVCPTVPLVFAMPGADVQSFNIADARDLDLAGITHSRLRSRSTSP